MLNPISSPGDPLFYLHHTFLDRVWWQWQEKNLPARLTDIAGYTTPNGPVNATLDDELNMFGVIPNATIRDVMDIRGPLLCFEYV
jgi:tyrosinase